MRNSTTRRQSWITAYRISTLALLVAICALSAAGLVWRPSTPSQPIVTVAQADKVEQAASFLEAVGFNDPEYLGITPGYEGEYPTFRALAIGGKSVDLWIRTTPLGGWEIQPVVLFETVASADDFARKAQQAVSDWQNMPSDVKPRTDGSSGEWEERKSNYDRLAQYNPDASYWTHSHDETRGWPAK